MTPPQLIENWFIGDLQANVPPFCTLKAGDVRHIKGADGSLRKMKRFMKFIERMGRQHNVWGDRLRDNPTGWNISNVKELWEGIQKDFKSKYMRGCKRKGELSWSTPYNNMKNSPSSGGDGGGSGGSGGGEEET